MEDTKEFLKILRLKYLSRDMMNITSKIWVGVCLSPSRSLTHTRLKIVSNRTVEFQTKSPTRLTSTLTNLKGLLFSRGISLKYKKIRITRTLSINKRE